MTEAGKIAVELDDQGFDAGVEAELPVGQLSFEGLPEPSDQIRIPFDPEEIDVATRTPTVDLLLSRLTRGALDLEPEFQRASGIWNETTQSRLIESLLLRIPLPTLYAAENPQEDGWIVVDGVQRLTTIARFVNPQAINAEPLMLRGLEYLDAYEGKYFTDLPTALRTRIAETELVLHLIKQGTPEEVKFNIFARINTGGSPLSLQELRHALIPGLARTLLKDLAQSAVFQIATLGSVSPQRMADREMVLRFLAFRLTPPRDYRRGDLNEFLRMAMHTLNELPQAELRGLTSDFDRAMHGASMIFGEHAFRKLYRGQSRRLPINKAIFEAISVSIAALQDDQLDALTEHRFEVQERFMDLMEDPGFHASVSVGTGDVAKVKLRFGHAQELLNSVAEGIA